MSASFPLSASIRRNGVVSPSSVIRKDKPSKHASMWNALASRRAEMNLNKVNVTIKKGAK